jgi:hypothetical protein
MIAGEGFDTSRTQERFLLTLTDHASATKVANLFKGKDGIRVVQPPKKISVHFLIS